MRRNPIQRTILKECQNHITKLVRKIALRYRGDWGKFRSKLPSPTARARSAASTGSLARSGGFNTSYPYCRRTSYAANKRGDAYPKAVRGGTPSVSAAAAAAAVLTALSPAPDAAAATSVPAADGCRIGM